MNGLVYVISQESIYRINSIILNCTNSIGVLLSQSLTISNRLFIINISIIICFISLNSCLHHHSYQLQIQIIPCYCQQQQTLLQHWIKLFFLQRLILQGIAVLFRKQYKSNPERHDETTKAYNNNNNNGIQPQQKQ
ncbi:hypothetical protein ACTA71_012643 [Dictyostelium dimigraforme]